MKADEIRKMSDKVSSLLDEAKKINDYQLAMDGANLLLSASLVEVLIEIAAQLAEANEKRQ